MVLHEIDHFEVRQVAILHILIELALLLLVAVLIGGVQIPATIVKIRAPD